MSQITITTSVFGRGFIKKKPDTKGGGIMAAERKPNIVFGVLFVLGALFFAGLATAYIGKLIESADAQHFGAAAFTGFIAAYLLYRAVRQFIGG